MFPTIVFGSIIVNSPGNATYTDGNSISAGGYRLFIVPTVATRAGIDIGFTYKNQFGQQKTTSITTAVGSGVSAGTHSLPVVLEAGDTGIQDIINVTIVGGFAGDRYNFESWNEGSGIVPLNISRTNMFNRNMPIPEDNLTQSNLPEPIRSSQSHLAKYTFYSVYELRDITINNIVPSQIPFRLTPETIEPNYTTDVADFGLMQPSTLVTKNDITKKLRIDLVPLTLYQYLDSNEQSTRLKWKWDPDIFQYIDVGFYKLTFDYDVEFDGTYFIFELLDKNGTIIWSKTTTGTGINQIASFKSLAWEFRLRCKSNYTSPASTTWHAQVSNIRIERYKDQGTITSIYGTDMNNISWYDRVEDTISPPAPQGTGVDIQLSFSDDNSSYSQFSGYDGTSNTHYSDNSSMIIAVPTGYIGYYYKWQARLLSDGRDTPTLVGLSIFAYCKNVTKKIDTIISLPEFYPSANPEIVVPVPLVRSNIVDISTDPLFDRNIVSMCLTNIKGDKVGWEPDSYGFRLFYGRAISTFSSWLESVVGQVTSGYVMNLDNEIIKNAFNIVIMSTARTDINPLGVTTTAIVNPNTGLYQIFLKKVVYDKRYVMIKLELKNVVLEGAGLPLLTDGNLQLPNPYNLQFACPSIDCNFDITRNIT